jgi:tetraacyldisaccharide 4'-kinase
VRLNDGGLALAEEMGDEPCMLARRNPAVPVYVGRNRAAAGRLAEIVDRPNVIVLDDAFQHLRLARDLNVLLVDAEQGLGNGLLLPLGNLREPAAAMRRADVVLITKAGLGDAEALRRRLETWLPGPDGTGEAARVPVFSCGYSSQRLMRLDGGASLPLSTLRGTETSLWCAIAQPEGFRKSLEGLGATVREMRAFRDHHPYTAAELAGLDLRLADAPADAAQWLTTSKDAVKLQGRLEHEDRLWVLEMEVVPEPAARAFFFDFLSALKLR